MVLGIALLPFVLRKSLQEIKIISVIFFVAIMIFILVLCIQMFTLGETYNPDKGTMGQYWHFRFTLLEITSFSILLCAYNYSFIEFPLYHALGPSRT